MAKKKEYTIGVDVGGTKMTAVLLEGTSVAADFTLATPRDNLDHFLVMLKALVEPLIIKAREAKIRVRGIGLGIPSVMDSKQERALSSPNLPMLNNINIINQIKNLFDLPAVMDNDVNCFLRAEVSQGAGQNYANVYGITIGTGIGGAWWYKREIYRGSTGGGGEPGSMIINFETGMGLEEAYQKLTKNNPAAVAEDAYRGDVLAEKTFIEVGDFLGVALANIVNLLEPELIIIGGGVIESSNLFLNEAKKIMKENIVSAEAKKKIKIAKSKLGARAGAIGAALMV